jgi:hypothetical protein
MMRLLQLLATRSSVCIAAKRPPLPQSFALRAAKSNQRCSLSEQSIILKHK